MSFSIQSEFKAKLDHIRPCLKMKTMMVLVVVVATLSLRLARNQEAREEHLSFLSSKKSLSQASRDESSCGEVTNDPDTCE